MEAFLATIDDLLQFARTAIFGVVTHGYTKNVTPTVSGELLMVAAPQSLIRHHTVIALPAAQSPDATTFRPGAAYFVGTLNGALFIDPVVAFDTVLSVLPYGTKVSVRTLHGRWAHVFVSDQSGWILKDDLVERITDVYPQLVPGVVYAYDDQQTMKLRCVIADAFSGARSDAVLSPAEYVQYKLVRKNRHIDWGDVRQRVAGTWQRKLRGNRSVYLGVAPKTDAVMEYIIDDVGHLAFVDAVYPDGSILVSEIGQVVDAMYSEYELSETAWRELRPIFISVV